MTEHDVEIRETLPNGKITAWRDGDDDDWIIGVRINASRWSQIAICHTEGNARLIARILDAMPRK